jgi:uncharacterized protein (UPF0332 family)
LTQENKKENISEELARARECLTSADLLFSHGQLADGVSRLYYYLYHAVRALLLSKGLEPTYGLIEKTHEGTLRLLNLYFTKPGILDVQTSHIFTRLMKYREEADYNPSYVFTKDDYTRFKVEADRLFEFIIERLRKEGMVEK